GHKGVRLLPRLLLLCPQRSHPLADQPTVLFRRTLPLGGTDEAGREQGQDGLEDLLARGLGTQDSSRLLHLAALLPTAVAAAPGRILLHLLPGGTRALGSKAIQLRPEADQERIDG